MAELKPGWQRVRFGDVVRLNKETCKAPEAEGIKRVIGLEHLEPGDLRVRSWGYVADGTTFTKRVRPGQVLFGKRRAYQRKVAVADFDAVCSGDIYALETIRQDVLLPELLPFICQKSAFFEHAVETSAGSLSPRTNWSKLAEYELELPPLDEQRHISANANAAFAMASALDDASIAAEAAYRSLSLSLMRPKEGWQLIPLGELTEHDAPICYGIVKLGEGQSRDVPVLRTQNLNGDYDDLYYASARVDAEFRRSRVQGGDILVAIQGASTGKIGLVPRGFYGNINRHVARIRPGERLETSFFLHLWKSPAFSRYAASNAVGSTKPELTIGALRALKIPLPPLEAQHLIAESLSAIKNQSQSLSMRAAAARELLKNFVESSWA